MSKKILNSQSTKQKALETITEIAAVVKATLGPGGNPIILQRSGHNPDGTPIGPLITKDGVTVADYASTFKDQTKDTIAKAILQVAKNTVNQAGDGPQPLYSKVLTPKGFIEMRDVKTGTEVCGTNGSVQKVEDIVVGDLLMVPIKQLSFPVSKSLSIFCLTSSFSSPWINSAHCISSFSFSPCSLC